MSSPPSSRSNTTVVTRYILIAIALVAVAALLWRIRDALVIAFGGIVFATMLRAFARPLQRHAKLPERWSVAVVLLLLVVAVGLLTWLFGARLAAQVEEFRDRLPAAVEQVTRFAEKTPMGRSVMDTLRQSMDGDAMSRLGTIMSATVAGLANLLIIVFAGAYFAFDPRLYRRGALRLVPPARRAQVDGALQDAGGALSKWLVAQLIVMASVGVLTGIGLWLLDVPLFFLLALLIGVLEFVPVVGPIVAAVPGVLLAFTQGPATAFHATLVYIGVQQVESNLLTPLIQRWAVELPPVVALLSILAGGLLFGPLGVLFATPLAVVTMVLVQHLYVEDTIERK